MKNEKHQHQVLCPVSWNVLRHIHRRMRHEILKPVSKIYIIRGILKYFNVFASILINFHEKNNRIYKKIKIIKQLLVFHERRFPRYKTWN